MKKLKKLPLVWQKVKNGFVYPFAVIFGLGVVLFEWIKYETNWFQRISFLLGIVVGVFLFTKGINIWVSLLIFLSIWFLFNRFFLQKKFWRNVWKNKWSIISYPFWALVIVTAIFVFIQNVYEGSWLMFWVSLIAGLIVGGLLTEIYEGSFFKGKYYWGIGFIVIIFALFSQSIKRVNPSGNRALYNYSTEIWETPGDWIPCNPFLFELQSISTEKTYYVRSNQYYDEVFVQFNKEQATYWLAENDNQVQRILEMVLYDVPMGISKKQQDAIERKLYRSLNQKGGCKSVKWKRSLNRIR
jgi:hypothetical protein